MEIMITMITAGFAISVVWATFFYITGIRKDRKILDDYIADKHKRNYRFKKRASAGKMRVPSA